jgi:hypothetical protein
MKDTDINIARGFSPFQPLMWLGPTCAAVPDAPGVYAVALDVATTPGFLACSVGGHFKGQDPTVSVDLLREKWVGGAPVVYIGRAKSLRARLRLLVRYGSGEPVAHRGGRYLWQLVDHRSLRVAWRVEAEPVRAEAELIDAFAAVHRALPFANLVRGARTDTS